jgi:Phytochelatin synthase
MSSSRLLIHATALTVCLGEASALADRLALPPNLIGLGSEAGTQLLVESSARAAYWPLSMQFVTQKNQSDCGVATLVMVLNALEVQAPPSPDIEPYTTFTQDDMLNAQTEAILPREVLAEKGMTLDQFARLLGSHGVRTDTRQAEDSSAEHFRASAATHLATPGRYVVANNLRRSIGRECGGPISPLAAYDARTDRFLVLDVSLYKYPPVWVQTRELFAAMDTVDANNEGRRRGFVLARRGDGK